MLAGISALEDVEYFEKIRAEINESKIELKTFLESLNAIVYDSYANFLLVDFKNKADFVYNKLKNANISVKLFKKGSLLENHLRITKNYIKICRKILNINFWGLIIIRLDTILKKLILIMK